MQRKGLFHRGESAQSMDMTQGSLWRKIFFFSMPLMLSQILQVTFNMADVAVVGKFASAQALGSVGSTSMLVSLFTGLLIGLGSGVNALTAQHLGARRSRETSEAVHTSLLICLLSGVLISVLCLLLAKPMLEMMNTKADLIDGAVLYFRIYALGMPALGVFNFGNGVMSANGDTRRPLLYLTISGVLNVALNLFFVICCRMAADGVALASILSQYVSAILIVWHLLREQDDCALRPGQLRFHREQSFGVLALGIPAGLQNAIFAVANIFIQAGLNSFDSTVVEGGAAAANADTLIYSMLAAFYTACTSFMGQNWGARKRDRTRESYLVSLVYSAVVGLVMGLFMVFFGEAFLSLFTNDADVVAAGMERLRIMGFSYAISPFMDCTIAASRGIGKSFAPTVIVILGSCVFRVIWVYTIFASIHTITALYLLYPCSWILTSVAEIGYFVSCYRRSTPIGPEPNLQKA